MGIYALLINLIFYYSLEDPDYFLNLHYHVPKKIFRKHLTQEQLDVLNEHIDSSSVGRIGLGQKDGHRCSIMFCDLCNFTNISWGLTSDIILDILQDFFHYCSEKIVYFKGWPLYCSSLKNSDLYKNTAVPDFWSYAVVKFCITITVCVFGHVVVSLRADKGGCVVAIRQSAARPPNRTRDTLRTASTCLEWSVHLVPISTHKK